MKGMKKILLGIVLLFCATVFFAQTKQIDASKLVKTLEKNKKTSIVFASSVNLKGLSIKSDGALTIPSLASEKIKFIAGIDTEALQERLAYLLYKKRPAEAAGREGTYHRYAPCRNRQAERAVEGTGLQCRNLDGRQSPSGRAGNDTGRSVGYTG